MSENTRIVKNAGTIGLATLASRILGFVRDVCIAGFFGAGFYSDAFFAAFRIPNLMRRLFAEGSLSMAFVSVFTQYLVKKGKTEAYEFAGSALKLISVLLVLLSLLGILASPWIVHLVAPGFKAVPDKFELTVLMNRIMFPYIFFIGLVAVCMGILNVLGHFAAPALAPVLLNIAMIGSMLWISPHMAQPVLGLCFGVVIGGVLQLGLQTPFVIRKGIRLSNRSGFFHPGIKKTGSLMMPMIFGAAAYQVNVLVGTFLASFLAQGSISYLYYADRLVQFPLGLFAVAASTAALPVLSRQAADGNLEDVRDTFGYALNSVFYVAIPAMVGLIVLRVPILEVLFQRGEFDAAAVQFTSAALLCYGVGIWAFSAVRVLISTYYALQDTRTPVKIALVSIAANILLASLLMIPMGYAGIALATSISSAVNFCLLLKDLSKKLGGMDWKKMMVSSGKTVAGSLLMGIGVTCLSRMWIKEGQSIWHTGVGLFACIFSGIFLYGVYSALIGHPEFQGMMAILKQKMILKKSAAE